LLQALLVCPRICLEAEIKSDDVPWMPVAVAVGLSDLGVTVSEIIKCIGTNSEFDKSTDTILGDVSYVASRKKRSPRKN